MGSGTIDRPRPLVVIGGGTAGVASAVEAARCGLAVTLIDEGVDPEAKWPEDLRRDRDALADRIDVASGVAVLNVTAGREVLWAGGRSSGVSRAGGIVLATGGSPRPVPFPGWTLDGVIGASAVPAAIAEGSVGPGRTALVAGTGPGLLTAAVTLLGAGVRVVGVLEAGRPPWAEGQTMMGPFAGLPERLGRAGVPIRFHHAAFSASGRDRVEAATWGPVDEEGWRPMRDRASDAGIDLLVLDFGQSPNGELSVLAGCEQRFDAVTNAWLASRDALMRTTVPGILAAGDGAGVASWVAAREEGRIAGITAAEDAGAISRDEADARRGRTTGEMLRLGELRSTWERASRLRPGLLDSIAPSTVLCRCEGTTLADVRAAREEGARDVSSIKLLSRLGMGPCQGRECGSIGGLIAAREVGRSPEAIGRINPRPPVRPVTLGALSRMHGVSRSHASDPGDALGGRVLP